MTVEQKLDQRYRYQRNWTALNDVERALRDCIATLDECADVERKMVELVAVINRRKKTLTFLLEVATIHQSHEY